GRLKADFLPPDRSFVGPNLVAAIVQAAVVFTFAVLLWPPWRRRLHRFVDRKLAPLHRGVDGLHARHDTHHEHLDRITASLEEAHRKLDELGRGPKDES